MNEDFKKSELLKEMARLLALIKEKEKTIEEKDCALEEKEQRIEELISGLAKQSKELARLQASN